MTDLYNDPSGPRWSGNVAVKPPLPWHGGNGSGLGSSAAQKRPAHVFPSSTLCCSLRGVERGEESSDRTDNFHCFFFLICKMFMKNHVCLQEICLHGRWERRIRKVSVADMVWKPLWRVVGRVCAGWYPCLLALHWSWVPQVQSQPARLCTGVCCTLCPVSDTLWRWHRTWLERNEGSLVLRQQQSWGAHCQQDPTCFSFLLLMPRWTNSFWKKESVKCVCKQIAELARKMCLYQCPAVIGLVVCSVLCSWHTYNSFC